VFWIAWNNIYICIPILIGRVAEWLGRGLQNLVQRFESALDLKIKAPSAGAFFVSADTEAALIRISLFMFFDISFLKTEISQPRWMAPSVYSLLKPAWAFLFPPAAEEAKQLVKAAENLLL
jgi:hypothetical protein